jgi:hypothetical protein
MLSSEAMLLAVYVGLYFYDAFLLLRPNEAILKAGFASQWRSSFGSKNTTFFGKELYIPNPFAPSTPIFRLSWQYESPGPSSSTGWGACIPTLRWFLVPTWLLFFCSFVLLPIALFGHFGDFLILVAFAAIYLCVAMIVVLLYFAKRSLSIAHREFWLAALDLFICPPFAINVVRRLSLRQIVTEDFVEAARRLQGDEPWRDTATELCRRLMDEVNGEDEDSPRAIALKNRIALLTPVNHDEL